MNDKRRIHISKFISKHLRHEPEAIGLVLEPGGWVLIDALLAASDAVGMPISLEELQHVVARCEKQRFAFDDASTRIRANQGHSTEVDLQLGEAEPPDVLYHGTAEHNLHSILDEGLRKMARHHVHLSPDTATGTRSVRGTVNRRSLRSTQSECEETATSFYAPSMAYGL